VQQLEAIRVLPVIDQNDALRSKRFPDPWKRILEKLIQSAGGAHELNKFAGKSLFGIYSIFRNGRGLHYLPFHRTVSFLCHIAGVCVFGLSGYCKRENI
jgi:hypothetical protein